MPKIKYNEEKKKWEELEKYSKDGVYMDGYLKSNLDYLEKSLHNDYDLFIAIDGRERFGKSTLGGQVAKYLDPTYNLDRCVFTADQFMEAVAKAKPFQAIVFDEAHGYLGSRQSMSKFNRMLIKVMSEMGSKNLIVIIILPNFFELDKYPAIHRTSCLINVHQRGSFKLFNYEKKKQLYLKGKRFYAYNVSANFHGKFTKWFPLDKQDYQAKKDISTVEDAKINNREKKYLNQRNLLIQDLYFNYKLTQEAIAKKLPNMGRVGISEIISKDLGVVKEQAAHTIIRTREGGSNITKAGSVENKKIQDQMKIDLANKITGGLIQ